LGHSFAVTLLARPSAACARFFQFQSDSRPIVPSLQLDLGGRLEPQNVLGDGEQLSTASLGVLLGVNF
jgi:hypothetical protein